MDTRLDEINATKTLFVFTTVRNNNKTNKLGTATNQTYACFVL